MSKPFRPSKIEFYWIEPEPRQKRKLFKDEKFQFMRTEIRREA